MEVISGRVVSGLNPYAVPFVPGAYRAVEDYSPEWWQLVESSASFRDYWLRECFHVSPSQDEEAPDLGDNYEPVLPDADSLFHSYPPQTAVDEEKGERLRGWELMTWGAEKWRGAGGRAVGPKYMDKAPRFVNAKVTPRTIQQPR